MALQQLKTTWGENVGDMPLQEYPRPQFQRKSYLNLNGWWDCTFSKNQQLPKHYDTKILVPFSPETTLSGVGRQLQPDEFLFYRRTISLAKSFNKGLVLLNFGAVDSVCDVFVNGVHCCHHEGGYNAFSTDITKALSDTMQNEIVVRVADYSDTKHYTNGKQALKRGGMWYTAQSGIWQTVWMESVPTEYIASARITPDIDLGQVTIELDCNFKDNVTVTVLDGDKEVAKADGKDKIVVKMPGDFKLWSPEHPHLYNLLLVSRRDMVQSYFGMRKFGVETVGKYKRLMLNNQPYFHNGLLDQGYWSDGLYTAPSDQALVFDIQTMKDLGFNMLRKHIKVEPMRWYYHCDRLGMLVWQDMPSGGTYQHKMSTLYIPHVFMCMRKMKDSNYKRFSRQSEQSRDMFHTEYVEMLDQLYNCTCIAMWVPFNESWGQFDAKQIAQFTKEYDPTRTVDHASGWHDQGGGDCNSMHVYYRKMRTKRDKKRAVVLSEFGGYCLKDAEHSFNPDKTYGYKLLESKEQFGQELAKLFQRDVEKQIAKGLCASVYTQVSDVEDEVNGLLTFDRKVLKVDADTMRAINKKVKL